MFEVYAKKYKKTLIVIIIIAVVLIAKSMCGCSNVTEPEQVEKTINTTVECDQMDNIYYAGYYCSEDDWTDGNVQVDLNKPVNLNKFVVTIDRESKYQLDSYYLYFGKDSSGNWIFKDILRADRNNERTYKQYTINNKRINRMVWQISTQQNIKFTVSAEILAYKN